MDRILTIEEAKFINCLARRKQGKATFVGKDEYWFTDPFDYYHNCLICDKQVATLYLIQHARDHIKESKLKVFL